MALIYETKNFEVTTREKPHIDRLDGGHLIISPKRKIDSRTELTREEASEFIQLSIISGRAMTEVLRDHGIDIGRINYQENGNWNVNSPEGNHMHLHLYGRAKDAKVQKYGHACYFPRKEDDPSFYEHVKPLTDDDIVAIREKITKYWEED